MLSKRSKVLPGSGSVSFNAREGYAASMIMTGNVSLRLAGFEDGEIIFLNVKQDAIGGRTLTIIPATGTTNVAGVNGIDSGPNRTTEVVIKNIKGVYNISYNQLANPGSGGGGATLPANLPIVASDASGTGIDGSANVITRTLTGFSTTNSVITASDTILTMAGKAQGQISAVSTVANNAQSAASTAQSTANTAQTTANNAQTAATALQTQADSIQDFIQPGIVGAVYNKSTWTNLADFSTNTVSATISGGKISIPNANVTDFTKSLQLSTYSCINHWKFQIEFQLTQAPAAGTTGISIGIQGQNSNSLNSIAVYFRCVNDGNLGRMEFFSQSNGGSWVTNTPAATSNLSLAANDNIRLSIERHNQDIIMFAENLTNPIAPASLRFTMPYNTNPIPPSTGRFTIFAQGGTFTINKMLVLNKEIKNTNILLLGDSKTMGYGATNFYTTYPGFLGASYQNVVIAAGFGDKTADVLNRLPEILAISPKQVILAIGSNDARFSVPNTTFQANYQSIVSQLVAAGISVVHLSPAYEVALDLSAQNTFITSTYPGKVVDIFYITKEAGNRYSDDIHLSDAGNQQVAATINNSVDGSNLPLISGKKYNQDFYYRPLTINNATTSVLTDTTLNSLYPTLSIGARVIAANTTGGGITYEKISNAAWIRYAHLS